MVAEQFYRDFEDIVVAPNTLAREAHRTLECIVQMASPRSIRELGQLTDRSLIGSLFSLSIPSLKRLAQVTGVRVRARREVSQMCHEAYDDVHEDPEAQDLFETLNVTCQESNGALFLAFVLVQQPGLRKIDEWHHSRGDVDPRGDLGYITSSRDCVPFLRGTCTGSEEGEVDVGDCGGLDGADGPFSRFASFVSAVGSVFGPVSLAESACNHAYGTCHSIWEHVRSSSGMGRLCHVLAGSDNGSSDDPSLRGETTDRELFAPDPDDSGSEEEEVVTAQATETPGKRENGHARRR